MKAEEIIVGGTYVGENGSIRRVTGDADSRSSKQRGHDEVQFEILAGEHVGGRYSVLRKSFAQWAVRRVETDGVDGGE